MLMVVQHVSFVYIPVLVDMLSVAVHFPVEPITLIGTSSFPDHMAFPLFCVIHKIPCILVSVCFKQLALALHLAAHPISIVSLATRPVSDPLTKLGSVHPHSFVEADPIAVGLLTLTLRLASIPLAVVNTLVLVSNNTFTMR